MTKLYMMITQDEYQLPLIVASNVPELSRKTGWGIKRIWTYLNHVKNGSIKKPKFIEVVLDDEDCFKEIIKTEKCCGTCIWHKHEHISKDWFCLNIDGKNCFRVTEYRHSCPKYEER